MYYLILLGMLLAVPAFAAEPAPCERGPSNLVAQGVSMDMLRCREAVMQQHLGQMDLAAMSLQAELTLAQKDVEHSKADAVAIEKRWADYFAAYVGSDTPK